jgi:hypothetical protein
MNSILLAGRKIGSRFQREGVSASLHYLVRRAKQITHHAFYDAHIDRLEVYASGVQRWVKSDEIVGTPDRAQVNYDAYPRLPFLWALAGLKIDPREFSFVDFGSGRGRIVLAAAGLPFKRCIGVEFSKTLHAEALANIANFSKDKLACRNNTALNLDAREFALPEGNIVAFFFNPFLGAILDRVAQNIEDAARQSKRTLYVVFANTTGADLFPNRTAFKRIQPRGFARLKLALFGTIPLEFYRVDER